MAPKSKQPDDDRALKTIYVTGFNPKLMKKHLLKELFSQGGAVTDVLLFETHAYVHFQHAESVPYCLALFNDVEMFGDKLRMKPRSHSGGNPYTYLDYLTQVRNKLREEYSSVEPPNLPAKKYSNQDKSAGKQNKRHTSRQTNRQTGRPTSRHISKSPNKHANASNNHQPKKYLKKQRAQKRSKIQKRVG